MSYNASLISSSFKYLLATAFLCVCLFAEAQTDTTLTQPRDTLEVIEVERGTVTGDVKSVDAPPEESVYYHSPKKATIMSAILPGLGQVYNKKYWKIPVLYGGIAVTGYFLNDNLKNIDKYKALYLTETDPRKKDFYDRNIDQYKSWRDLSYIAFAVIYALNIIDANVDAHLFYFDVSEDISLNWAPYLSPNRHQGVGLSLTLKL